MAYKYFDHREGHSTEMSGKAMGLYPGKYCIDMPAGKDPVEVNIFASHFSPRAVSTRTKTSEQKVRSTGLLNTDGKF